MDIKQIEENNAKFFENMEKEYQEASEGIKLAQEWDKLCNENPGSAKQILLDGMRTEFWKYFKALLIRTRYSMEVNLKRGKINGLDDLIRASIFNNIYKQNDEIINMPLTIVRQLEAKISFLNKQNAQNH